MNLRAPRDLIRARFAASVTAAGYDVTTRVDWSAFGGSPLIAAEVDPSTLPGLIEGCWFRPHMYSIPGTSQPMCVGPDAATERDARLLIGAFVPWGEGEDEILSALSSIAHGMQRDSAGNRETLTDGNGCYVYVRDPEELDVLGRRGQYLQVNVLVPLFIQDHSDAPALFPLLESGGFPILESGAGRPLLEAA